MWGLTDAVGAGQLWSLPLQTLVPEWRALSLPSEWGVGDCRVSGERPVGEVPAAESCGL